MQSKKRLIIKNFEKKFKLTRLTRKLRYKNEIPSLKREKNLEKKIKDKLG